MVFYLLLLDAVGDFRVQAIAGTDQDDFGVGVEEVEDAACCYLSYMSGQYSCMNVFRYMHVLTSPPPITKTFLFLTCQAKIKEPPPSTSGNFSPMMWES